MALVEQLGGDGRWFVTVCHHMALVFAIMHLRNSSSLNFLLFFPFPVLYFSLIWYRWIGWNGWQYQHVLALCFLENRGDTEGSNSEGLCLMFVYYYVATHFVCVCLAVGFVDWHNKRFLYNCIIYEKSFEMCMLMTELDCPEVTLYGWQNIKIQLLTD